MKRLILAALILATPAQAFAQVDDEQAVRAIIGEASNQGLEGMQAVAEGIRNRGTLKGVYGAKAKHVDKEPAWVWKQARKAWEASKASNLVGGATNWENTKAFGEPYWAKSMVKTAQIGDHVYFKKPERTNGQA